MAEFSLPPMEYAGRIEPLREVMVAERLDAFVVFLAIRVAYLIHVIVMPAPLAIFGLNRDGVADTPNFSDAVRLVAASRRYPWWRVGMSEKTEVGRSPRGCVRRECGR